MTVTSTDRINVRAVWIKHLIMLQPTLAGIVGVGFIPLAIDVTRAVAELKAVHQFMRDDPCRRIYLKTVRSDIKLCEGCAALFIKPRPIAAVITRDIELIRCARIGADVVGRLTVAEDFHKDLPSFLQVT